MKTILAFLLCALTAQAANVPLIWDRNPEPEVNQYRVYIGTASRTYDRIESAGNNVTYDVLNLTPGVTYYFAVTAVNVDGLESDYSNELAYRVPFPKPSAPGTPRIRTDGASIDWRGVTNRTGTSVQPVLIVPGEPGLAVKAAVSTPAGTTTRTLTIGPSGKAEFAGKSTVRPFTATGDISLVSIDPNVTVTQAFE